MALMTTTRFTSFVAAAMLFASIGCGGGSRPRAGRPAPAGYGLDDPSDAKNTGVSQAAGLPAPQAVPNSPAASQDGPHISRSVGEKGGVVVLWPRVIPRTKDPVIAGYASEIQRRLVTIAKQRFAGRVDVRPEPERVCPRTGCDGVTLSALLIHDGGGCTVVAYAARPGVSPARLRPWAGRVRLKKQEIPFRSYPEEALTISDAVPCSDLLAALDEGRESPEAVLLEKSE